MIKKEIRSFQAFAGCDAVLDVALPITLAECISFSEIGDEVELAALSKEKRMEPFTLRASLDIDASMAGFRGAVLLLMGIVGHCIVSLNGNRVAEWRSPPAKAYIPIENKPGALLLEIFFPEREKPMDVGLLGGAELIAYSHDVITDIYTEQTHKNDKCELFIRAKTLHGVGDGETVATLYSPSGEIHYVGLLHGEGRILLPSVHRFRAAGSGASSLYRLVVTLYAEGMPADSCETVIGLRKLSFSKDGDAIPFEAMLNDSKLFVKAARISSAPAPYAKDTLSSFERALSSFVKIGGNALLVTAEQGLLSDSVYSLCDRKGILVIQQLPMPLDPSGDLSPYFAELKASLQPLINHPSLALLLLPDGIQQSSELARSIKGFFAFSFPSVNVRAFPTFGFEDAATVPSMPSALAVRRCLPMEARRIFSYAMESAQESSDQLISMLSTAAEELPYGACLEDVCYVTAVSSANRAQRALSNALDKGVPGGMILGTLFEGGISMKPSLMDGISQRKALYFDLEKTFSPVFLYAEAENCGVRIRLASSGDAPIDLLVVTTLMDRSNEQISQQSDTLSLAPGSPLELKKSLPAAQLHEREYYVHIAVSRDGCPLCEQTVLFVPSKHFRFVYPNLQYEIKGSGKKYELTLSASAYVRRLQISFSKTAASLSRNYFDIVSDAKVTLQIETEEITTSQLLDAQLRLRSLYDVGRISEQDLLDEADLDT